TDDEDQRSRPSLTDDDRQGAGTSRTIDAVEALLGRFLERIEAEMLVEAAAVCWRGEAGIARAAIGPSVSRSPTEVLEQWREGREEDLAPEPTGNLEIPLRADGQLRGAAVVERKSKRRFSPDEIETAHSLGTGFGALLADISD
ncbi:MAG: hypothetical protein ABEN55_21600, partial [Bradymonadaceae bacterium]